MQKLDLIVKPRCLSVIQMCFAVKQDNNNTLHHSITEPYNTNQHFTNKHKKSKAKSQDNAKS